MLKDVVKTLRKSKGWTQRELANKAKVSQQAIGKIESGRARESRKLPQIAIALGVTVEELTGEKHDAGSVLTSTALSAREWKLIEAFRNADDGVKKAIEGAAGVPFTKHPRITTKANQSKSSRTGTY